jgi:CelD/BcsL family acetyltransferase involved in cellulose biosynthesis
MEIGRDWELCQKRWSGKLRYNMGRGARKLSKGGVQFKRYSQPEPEELEALLRRGFDVEHRSWKGQARSSILARGQFGFVLRQAEQLARWGQLELAFLEAGARTIAFCYGFNAKGVYHVCKMAYDPESEYATFSPGQLLLYNILERLHRDQDCRALDFFGRLTEAMSKWRPATYAIGRVVVAPRRLLGRVAVHTYKHWWPQIRRFRGSLELLSPKTGG